MGTGLLHRLSTFVEWPETATLCPSTLARIGFRYSEDSDTVTCCECDVDHQSDSCSQTEDLLELHKQSSPFCRLEDTNTEEIIYSRYNEENTDYGFDNINAGLSWSRQIRETLISFANRTANATTRLESDFEKLRSETIRLSTFYDWPQESSARPQALARDGLYYKGAGDRVSCAFCNGCIGDWNLTDTPATTKHKTLFPQCPFVLGRDVGNISLIRHNSRRRRSNRSQTLRSPLETRSFLSSSPQPIVQNLGSPPRYSEYEDIERRIGSFRDRTVPQGQTPETLAEAGFFYIGPADRVQCFHCGGILKEWESEDNPIDEHLRWFDSCSFVKTLQSQTNNVSTVSMASAFRIEPHEIKARLDSPIVRIVLNMGFSVDLVRQVLEDRFSNAGDDFQSAESLLEAVLAREEEISSASCERHPQTSNTVSSFQANPSSSSELNFVNQELEVEREESDEEATGHEKSLQFVEENRRLREARVCKVCMASEVNVVFLPCGHLICCSNCSSLIQNCPLCHACVKGTVKTFLS